ncbi:MAG: DUF2805 domain-containing protein [Flavobacteriales bacterium]
MKGTFCITAKAHSFEPEELDCIIDMAREDQTPFDIVKAQFEPQKKMAPKPRCAST